MPILAYIGILTAGRSNTIGRTMLAGSIYEAETGRKVVFPDQFDIVVRYDEARDAEDAFTKKFYFDEKGELVYSFILYPNDSATLTRNFLEHIDVTDRVFSAGTSKAGKDVSEQINGRLVDLGDL